MKKVFSNLFILLVLLVSLALGFLGGVLINQNFSSYLAMQESGENKSTNFQGKRFGSLMTRKIKEISMLAFEVLKEKEPDHPDEAFKFRKLQIQNEDGLIPFDGLEKAAKQIDLMKAEQELTSSSAGVTRSSWTWLGPGNIGGRVRSILIHPTISNTIWAASVSGGIWKTTDGGISWYVLDDFMTNMAVSTLVIDPTNPDILYAGTGESYSADALRGSGIFKTSNGGLTWEQLSATNNSFFRVVNRLAISHDGNTILAATWTGIRRSEDAGSSWERIYPLDKYIPIYDINFHPSDSSKAIASGHGEAWFSTNGGFDWTPAVFTPTPSNPGRIEVAYAPNSPDIVYASINVNDGEIWKSSDGGNHYSRINTGTNYFKTFLGPNQGDYDNTIWVDPTDSDVLVIGGIHLWRSSDGGANLTQISDTNMPISPHPDHHIIIEDPGFDGSLNKKVYFGNDGGVYRADDIYTANTDEGWTELNNNLGISQFYGASGSPINGVIHGGTQDNGTLLFNPVGGTEGWTMMEEGDGGFSATDLVDPKYLYGEYIYSKIYRSNDGGNTVQDIYSGYLGVGGIGDTCDGCSNFIAPFVLDPNNSNTIYAGGRSLWRSTNVKDWVPTWTSIKSANSNNTPLSAIAVAPGNSNSIWLGDNDGNVYKTTDGGSTWITIEVNAKSNPSTPNSLPDRYVTRITIDKNDIDKVYVLFGGFSSDNVWRTTDGGASWNDVTGSGATGLPDVPVRSLVIHPDNSNWLYVGTELGTFTSEDGGSNWAVPHDGPTNTSVDELFWMNNTLVAATHGRGLFKAVVLPVNDEFNNAEAISTLPMLKTRDISQATTASDDPILNCMGTKGLNSVWYSFTPSSDGVLTANTFGSGYDTVLALWKGTRGHLTSMNCSDDYVTTAGPSQIKSLLKAGRTYYLEVVKYLDPPADKTSNPIHGGDQLPEKVLVAATSAGDLTLNVSFAEGNPNGALFTTYDNQDNPTSGDGDGDMDAYIFNTDPVHPIEFTINIPDASGLTTASLLMSNWDVDWSSGEVDNVYVNGHFAGTLSGVNNSWSTTSLVLNPAWLVSGENVIRINVDLNNSGWWAVTINWAQLILNGMTAGTASVPALNLNQTSYKPGGTIHVDANVDTTLLSQDVWVEFNLLSPSGNILAGTAVQHTISGADINQSLTGSAVDTVSADIAVPANAGAGKYTVQVLLFDSNTNLVQDLEVKTFDMQVTTKKFTSTGTQDGWILETSENSNLGGTTNIIGSTLLVGDSIGDKQYRSILSFPTAAGLPDNAVIVNATLKLRKCSLVGTNPFITHLGLLYDIRKSYFGTSSALVASDFKATASLQNAGSFNSVPVSSWYSAVLSSSAKSLIYKTGTTGLTQFRVRFSKDDNDDNGNDYFGFCSGNYAASSYRPALIVEYYIP